jgi:hypothetical protein
MIFVDIKTVLVKMLFSMSVFGYVLTFFMVETCVNKDLIVGRNFIFSYVKVICKYFISSCYIFSV